MIVFHTEQLGKKKKTQLQCWALGQATYILGGNQGVPSYAVGYGPDSPQIVQQMASSCRNQPRGPSSNSSTQEQRSPTCDWDSGFFPGIPNPGLGLVRGALVWGPSTGTDSYRGAARRFDDTRIRLEDNVGFSGLLAGLSDQAVDINSCFLGHGIWQRYVQTDGGI